MPMTMTRWRPFAELEELRSDIDRLFDGEGRSRRLALDVIEKTEEEKGKRFTRRERRFGSFSRSMTLPQGVNAQDIAATCHDGVLEVAIPMPEQEPSKRIEITPKAG